MSYFLKGFNSASMATLIIRCYASCVFSLLLTSPDTWLEINKSERTNPLKTKAFRFDNQVRDIYYASWLELSPHLFKKPQDILITAN